MILFILSFLLLAGGYIVARITLIVVFQFTFVQMTLAVLSPFVSIHLWFLAAAGLIAAIYYSPATNIFLRALTMRDIRRGNMLSRESIRLGIDTHQMVEDISNHTHSTSTKQEALEPSEKVRTRYFKAGDPRYEQFLHVASAIGVVIGLLFTAELFRWVLSYTLSWGWLNKFAFVWFVLIFAILVFLYRVTRVTGIAIVAIVIGVMVFFLPFNNAYEQISVLQTEQQYELQEEEMVNYAAEAAMGEWAWLGKELWKSNDPTPTTSVDYELQLQRIYQNIFNVKLLSVAFALAGAMI